MDWLKNKLEGFTPSRFFLFGLILLVLFAGIQCLFHGEEAVLSLLHLYADPNDTFMDFFNSIYDAGFENPYVERGVIYPPLTYLFYRFCGLFLCSRDAADAMVRGNEDFLNGAFYWRSSPEGLTLIIFLTVISMYLFYRTCVRGQKGNKQYHVTVLLVLLISVPFWFVYERGNLSLQTLLFLAFYVKNYRSESKIRRELALLSLAAAVSFKIYPVVFGVLLLQDKQFKEAIRCVIYGVLVFFLPFLAFGGLDSFPVMLSNIMSTSEVMTSRGFGYKVNIDNTLGFLFEPFGITPPHIFMVVVKLLLIVCMVFVLMRTKKDWQRYMVLSGVMMIFPGFSYTYTLIFAAIPLFAFLADCPKTTYRNLLFSLLFLGMFAPFVIDKVELYEYMPKMPYPLTLTTVVSSLSLLGMILLVTVDTIWNMAAAKMRTGSPNVNSGKDSFRTVVGFVITIAVVAGAMKYGYGICRYYYKENTIMPSATAMELDRLLSESIQTTDHVAYFSNKPFFEKELFQKYEEVRWVQISDTRTYLITPEDTADMRGFLELIHRNLPKAFIYYVYPIDSLEDYRHTAEEIEQAITIEDLFEQFTQENGYVLKEKIPATEDSYVCLCIKSE